LHKSERPQLAAARPLKLTRAQRVLRKADFDAAFAGGRRVSDAMFVLTIKAPLPQTIGSARIGLAIAAKTIGNSVARNRVRRTIRESFRLHQHELPAVDIIVAARAPARGAERARLRASLTQLWQQVIRQCAPSSAA
jgi:ribonuclease P protein component